MSEELLINISPMESRVAVLDNGVLGEIYIERHHKLIGSGRQYLFGYRRACPAGYASGLCRYRSVTDSVFTRQ